MNIDECSGIVYSTNSSWSYQVRTKCAEYGLIIDYAKDFNELLLYIIDNNGILFIDYNDFINLGILHNLENSNKLKNLTLVVICENNEINCEFNKRVHITTLQKLGELIPYLKYLNNSEEKDMPISKAQIYKSIIAMLGTFCFVPKHLGYTYLKDCIMCTIDNCYGICKFSGKVYSAIADKYNTCAKNVEKNISSAIKTAYERNPKAFKIDETGNLITTNASFINYMIEKVKIKCIEGVD